MDIYLVGGAVRDKHLGLPVSERDWVVVGSTPAAMLELGYQPVGKNFPVFLHPQTHEEYALARTERKTGPGYTGFETCADATISLEEDLMRRDLTINAMAESASGELIDPYKGMDDLNGRVLRHVSPAFAEDPVRILRAARFAARFSKLGFHLADTTNELMREMVAAGEADHLVAERIWAELVKALQTDTPARFFNVLAGCGALAVVFPELSGMANSNAVQGEDTINLPVLGQAVGNQVSIAIRFAAFACDMNNNHEAGLDDATLTAMCERYRIPNASKELARLALQYRQPLQAASTLSAEALLDILSQCDALRRNERFEDLLRVCAADAAARQIDFPAEFLQQALRRVREINAAALQQQGMSGKAIGEALQRLRIQALQQFIDQ